MGGKAFHRRVDGVLLLDKPLGLSSNAALQRSRRAYGALRAGHTGTLDPLASGLLPVCFGEATKLSAELLDAGKAYQARVRLGIRTSTADSEGEVLSEVKPEASREAILAALERFKGDLFQVPPMHSALKRNGEALYALARRGETVDRPPRAIRIYALNLLEFDGTDLELAVECSKGTYIRVLAEDIGDALGCGAHLAGLRRTRVGPFVLSDAISLAAVEDPCNRQAIDRWLLPVESLAGARPLVTLSAVRADAFRNGRAISPFRGPEGTVRVHGPDGRFLGLGSVAGESLTVRRGMSHEPQ